MEVTALLERVRAGEQGARDELIELVYEDLRRVAHRRMRDERRDHTLQATALLNLAIARIITPAQLDHLNNRKLFFSAAVRAMRQILIEYGRQRIKRPEIGEITIDPVVEGRAMDVLDLDAALTDLADLDRALHDVVALRYFAGLKVKEIATCQDVSTATVERQLRFAKDWIRTRLEVAE